MRFQALGLTLLLTGCTTYVAPPPDQPQATLSFDIQHDEHGPFVAHMFKAKTAGACKGTELISSISQGNPLVRTQDTADVPIAADAPFGAVVGLLPSRSYLRCIHSVRFSPKPGSSYRISGQYVRRENDRRDCAIRVYEDGVDITGSAATVLACKP
jgi:hypothetical protein